jgi:hypothetical protein
MTTDKPKRKRHMEEFRITEISCVDSPAQAPALARVIKGDGPTLIYKTGEELAEETRKRAEASTEKTAPAFATFDAAVEHMEGTGLSRLDALTKAASRFPDLLAGYQREGAREVDLDAPPQPYARKAQPKAVSDFDMLVDGIASRRNVSRTKAMALAQKEHPAAFEAYQAA